MRLTRILLLSLSLISSYHFTLAATWYSVVSGNAETGAIWSLTTTGPGSTAATLGGYNSTVDIVVQSGTTVDLFSFGNVNVRNIVVDAGGKLYSTSTANRYYNVYGNITCNGIIGDGTTFNSIAFNIEGVSCLISGTGSFDASRIRKSVNTNLVTDLTIAMNVNLRFDTSSGTQLYNNVAGTYSKFNVTLNAGYTLNLTGNGTVNGSASIDGIDGTGNGERTGNFTINGTMIITGILYAFTNNTGAGDSCNWVIGPNGKIIANQINCSASGAGKHNITIQPGGVLEVDGPNAFSPFSVTNNTIRCQSNSYINYSYAGNQTVEAAITYSSLNIATSGTKTSNGGLVINNDLNITGSSVLTANLNLITIKGNWSNWGQAGFAESTGSVRFSGTATQTIDCPGGEVFYNFQNQNASATGVQLNTNVTVTNDMNLYTVGRLTFGPVARTLILTKDNNTSSVLGNTNARIDLSSAAHVMQIACWASLYNGNLVGGQGTVIYNGTNNGSGFNQRIITGTNIAYNNVLLQGTGTKYTDNDITVGGNFTADGATVVYAALVNSGKTMTLGGNLSLINSGTMDVVCKDNISIVTSGNANQVFDGNYNPVYAFNLQSSKSAGNFSLTGPAGRTTVDLKNDFLLDQYGSAVFSDNANMITLGDDAQLGGVSSGAANYNFTGTIEFTASNNDGEIHISDFSGTGVSIAQLNHLKVNSGSVAAPANELEVYPLAGSQQLTVKGTVTILTNAVLDANANAINLKGNWTTWGPAGFNEAGSAVIFSGSANQQVNSTITPEQFNNITLSKAGGTVTLNTRLDVSGLATFVNGKMNTTAANILYFQPGSSTTGASNNSFVNGPVMKWGNTAFTFPTGKNSWYRPVAISLSVVSSEFQAEYFQSDPQSIPYDVLSKDPTLDHVSRCEFWTLSRVSGTSTPAVTLTWDATSCGVTLLNDLRVARWNGILWKDEGNGGTTGNTSTGSVISAGSISQFNVFTLSSTTLYNPLPVELLSFTGKRVDKIHRLEWMTAAELNNDYFEIERSSDNVHFYSLGRVAGHGTTSEVNKYSFNDSNPLPGSNYYRLHQIDFDGEASYSNVVFLKQQSSSPEIKIYPNPVQSELHITTGDDEVERIEVYNSTGHLIYTLSGNQISGSCTLPFENFSTGTYFISIRYRNEMVRTEKVVRL